MRVVHDLTELPVDFDESQPDLFVISEDPILLSNLVGYATSFSMSLGAFLSFGCLASHRIAWHHAPFPFPSTRFNAHLYAPLPPLNPPQAPS